MTIAARVRDAQISIEASSGARSFVNIARALAAAGTWSGAAKNYQHYRLSERDREICEKAAVSPMSFGGTNPLVDSGLVTAFASTLRASSAFDSMLPAMIRTPMNTKCAITTLGATGSVVGEGQVKRISQLQLAAGDALTPLKAIAILIVSQELAYSAAPGASDLFARELRGAVGVATDTQFISILSSGVTPTAASGTTAAAARTDINVLMQAVAVGANSKLFILTTSAIAKVLPLMDHYFFRTAMWNGGDIAGVQIIPSDGVPSGQIILVDASGVAADSADFELDNARHASIQLDDTPNSPPTASTVPTSLWQHNETALKCTRYFGAERLRSSAVAVISGVAYAP